MDETDTNQPHVGGLTDWALRPWMIAGVLAIAGAVLHFATDVYGDVPWRAAIAAFALFGGLAFAFAVDEGRELRAALFALVGGLVMAGIAWRTVSAGDGYSDAWFWVAAGVLALALALPLFQAGFLEDRWRTSYRAVHFHVWTNALSAAGALAFTGLSWALLAVLAGLFEAIEINLLFDLMEDGLFAWMFSGAAFGGALGVLRNQRKVLGTVQHVALLVLSILAVPFAAGLTLFLLALIVSGPQILWNATESATPLLLACAAGCFVLANAILRDEDKTMTGSTLLRWAARVLAALILPLTVFAAFSIGTRISQYGLSPERIWALIAIAVATAYGLAYAVSLARGWKSGAWRDTLRQANLHLAAGTSVIALLLALPILDFGAISTRDQLARLESGAVSVAKFDFDALKWDFGDAGRAALTRLAKSDDAAIAEAAEVANTQDSRPYRGMVEDPGDTAKRLANVAAPGLDPRVRSLLETYLADTSYRCQDQCTFLPVPRDGAADEWEAEFVLIDYGQITPMAIRDDALVEVDTLAQNAAASQAAGAPEPSGPIEVRPWSGWRVYRGDTPIGQPFD